jgi:predicted ABC-type exoprotein transport system permease subunit
MTLSIAVSGLVVSVAINIALIIAIVIYHRDLRWERLIRRGYQRQCDYYKSLGEWIEYEKKNI